MKTAGVTIDGGTRETGETVLILDKDETKLLVELASWYTSTFTTRRKSKLRSFADKIQAEVCML